MLCTGNVRVVNWIICLMPYRKSQVELREQIDRLAQGRCSNTNNIAISHCKDC